MLDRVKQTCARIVDLAQTKCITEYKIVTLFKLKIEAY